MKNIRRQIVWLALVPLLLLTGCMAGLFLHHRYADIDQSLIANGRQIAVQLAAHAAGGMNDELLGGQVASFRQLADVKSIAVLNAQGTVRVSAENLEPDHLRNHQTRDELVVRFPIRSGETGKSVQTGEVVVGMSCNNADRQKRVLLAGTLAFAAIFLCLAIYLLLAASRRITSPINRFCNDLKLVAQASPHAPQGAVTTDVCELEQLACSINLLTGKLQGEHDHLQRRAEQEAQLLRKKKEAAELDSLNSSRFLAVASHELRQPIHAVSLYIAELQRKVVGSELQHLVGQINHSIEVLANMLNGLLDISKLDARTIIPHIQTCSMSVLLERVSVSHVMIARIKNVRLVVRPCSCHVTSDPVLLERIAMNLVSNAIRYTEPGGSVLVACRRRGKYMHLEVRDNGIGIAPEDHEHIFREFHQCKHPAYEAGSDASKGLGLGLAIVDRLTKLLGHKLLLRSAPGRGSVFTLVIAAAPKPEVAREQTLAPLPASCRMAGKRILIVDDDPLILESTEHILRSWGCDVSSADSLKAVIQRLDQGETWDLVITDYQLEDNVTGLHVVNVLKEKHGLAPSCILITGNTSQELSKIITAGGGQVLYKPVRPAKLRSLVEYLLSGEPSGQD